MLSNMFLFCTQLLLIHAGLSSFTMGELLSTSCSLHTNLLENRIIGTTVNFRDMQEQTFRPFSYTQMIGECHLALVTRLQNQLPGCGTSGSMSDSDVF